MLDVGRVLVLNDNPAVYGGDCVVTFSTKPATVRGRSWPSTFLGHGSPSSILCTHSTARECQTDNVRHVV
jgi:hypothetical protein